MRGKTLVVAVILLSCTVACNPRSDSSGAFVNVASAEAPSFLQSGAAYNIRPEPPGLNSTIHIVEIDKKAGWIKVAEGGVWINLAAVITITPAQ